MRKTRDQRLTQPRKWQTGLGLAVVFILFATVAVISFRVPASAQEDTRAVGTVSIESTQPGELDVSWDPPTDTPRDYRIRWARDGEDFLTWTDTRGNAFPTEPSYTITDLDQGVRYKVEVRARYDGSAGPWTEGRSCCRCCSYSHGYRHTYASTCGAAFSHRNCHTYTST